MAAAKGTRPPAAGKGRQAGSQNRVTKALKEMVLGALVDAGGQEYLATQATKNPAAFLGLLGRVLPTTLAGDPNAPIVHRIERVIVRANPANPDRAGVVAAEERVR